MRRHGRNAASRSADLLDRRDEALASTRFYPVRRHRHVANGGMLSRRPRPREEIQRAVLRIDLPQVDRRIQEPLRILRHRPGLGTITMMNVEVHDGDARLPRGQRLRRGDRSVAEHAKPAAARTYIVALAHRVVPRRSHEHKGARAGASRRAPPPAPRRPPRASPRSTCPGRPASRQRPRRRRSRQGRASAASATGGRESRCSRPRRGSAPNERAAELRGSRARKSRRLA